MNNYDLSKLTVLIVEKQSPMRALLRAILREFGIRRIHDADTPRKGFEKFNRVAPDLVLVDWCPGFDGVGLVRRIRTDPDSSLPEVPIIMVTGYGESARVHQALDAGMSEYLVKPVSVNLLYVHIVNTIEKARPFIRSKTYTGPCRHRHKLPFAGNNRRRAARPAGVVAPPAARPERAALSALAPEIDHQTAKAA